MAHSLYDIEPLLSFIDGGYTLLTPNNRLAGAIREAWGRRRSDAGEGAWESPPVHALEHWLLQQWRDAVRDGLLPPRTLLSPSGERELWRQVIEEYATGSGNYPLLHESAAAELASAARETLLRWQVDCAAPGVRQQFELDADCGTFLAWRGLFEARLERRGLVTAADAIAALAGSGHRAGGAGAALLEFDAIAPLYRAALEALCQAVCEPPPARERADCRLHAFADTRGELQGVAAWAADLHRRDPGAAIGIVLGAGRGERMALEYLLRREFGCLGENYTSLPVNFSTGISLAEAPVARDALAVLDLGLSRTTVGAVVRLLRSRFLDLPDAGAPLAMQFLSRLYRRGSYEISVADLRYDAASARRGEDEGLALGRCLRAMSEDRPLRGRALPSEWSGRFARVLGYWGWPGPDALDSLEYQQVELWQRTLDEFRAFDAVCEPLDYAGALRLLRESCERQVSQPRTEHRPVQVLGPLEAAGLSFDHLWLCGMQATAWPAAPRPSPLIPPGLQARLDMPHATPEREWAYARGLLQRYRRAAGVLHASYCGLLDGVPDPPSALVADFVPQATAPPAAIDPAWAAAQAVDCRESLADDRAPPLAPSRAGDIAGGSGLVEDQSQCPFRAFARRRLKVEALPAFPVGLSALERGSLVHDALFALWGEIGDHTRLSRLPRAACAPAVERAARAALAVVPERRWRDLGNACRELEQQRLQGLMEEWLEVERARAGFVVQAREENVTLSLAPLRIQLKIDRIDRLPDGSRVIIDYKTGRCGVGDWDGERPARPQLLLYGLAVPEAPAALAFARVRRGDCAYAGLGRVAGIPGVGRGGRGRAAGEPMAAQDWAAQTALWHGILERLVREFVAGDARVDPLTASTCDWCGLQPLCRIGAVGEGE